MNKRSSLSLAATAALITMTPACGSASSTTSTTKSPSHDAAADLAGKSEIANQALMRGDGALYGKLVVPAADFTLMSPFGGKPSKGAPSPERMIEIGHFFKGGTLRQEVVQTYSSPDMIALAVIEHATVAVGDLPSQEWSLRVTLIYRRVGESWQLIHRHADPLAHAITIEQSAALGRGEATAPTQTHATLRATNAEISGDDAFVVANARGMRKR